MFNSNNGFTLTFFPQLQLLYHERKRQQWDERRRQQWDLFTVTDGYSLRDMHVSSSVIPLMEHIRQMHVIRIKQYKDCAYDDKTSDKWGQNYFVVNQEFEVIDRTRTAQVHYKVPERLPQPYCYPDVGGNVRVCDYPIKPMVDDQIDTSEIRLTFYPVLQIISLRQVPNRLNQYKVELTDGSSVIKGIVVDDNTSSSPVPALLRLFDVITVKRHTIMHHRNRPDVHIWNILQFTTVDRSHSCAIGKIHSKDRVSGAS